MRMIWNKGHRIRASDKHLVYHFSIGVIQQIKHCLFRHIKTGLL